MRNTSGFLILTACALMAGGCEKQPVAQAVATQPAPKVLASWNFDQSPVDQPPAGFVAKQNQPGRDPGTWRVTADPAAPSPPNVLNVQTKNANAIYNLLLAEDTSFKDLDIKVMVRGSTGKDDQGGGMIWRAKNEQNYYVCRMNPLETNFRVYKVWDNRRRELKSAEVKTEAGKWYEVRAVMVGDHIQCYLDGKKLLDVRDDQFKDAGMVGVWTKADASSSFDDLVVTEPQTPPTTTRAD